MPDVEPKALEGEALEKISGLIQEYFRAQADLAEASAFPDKVEAAQVRMEAFMKSMPPQGAQEVMQTVLTMTILTFQQTGCPGEVLNQMIFQSMIACGFVKPGEVVEAAVEGAEEEEEPAEETQH